MKKNIQNKNKNKNISALHKLMNRPIIVKPYKTERKEGLLRIGKILTIQNLIIDEYCNTLCSITPIHLSDDDLEVIKRRKFIRKLHDIHIGYTELRDTLIILLQKFDATYYEAIKMVNEYNVLEQHKPYKTGDKK